MPVAQPLHRAHFLVVDARAAGHYGRCDIKTMVVYQLVVTLSVFIVSTDIFQPQVPQCAVDFFLSP